MLISEWKPILYIVLAKAMSMYRAQNEAVDGVMAGFWGKCF